MTVTDLPSFTVEVFDRIVAMEKLAVPGAQAAGYASFDYPYGKLYWTNRLESIASPVTIGRGVDEYEFTLLIVMRLHTGYTTSGFEGDLETDIQTVHAPTVMQCFMARRDLVYQAGQARVNFMSSEIDISCASGLSIFEGDTPQVKMLGTEFRITVKGQFRIVRTV